MSPTALESLPDELLEHVFAYLIPEPDPDWLQEGPIRQHYLKTAPISDEARSRRFGLRSLCLVNKRMCSIAECLLHRNMFPSSSGSEDRAYYTYLSQSAVQEHSPRFWNSNIETQTSWLALRTDRLFQLEEPERFHVSNFANLRGLDIALLYATWSLVGHVVSALGYLPQLEALSFVMQTTCVQLLPNLYAAISTHMRGLKHLRLGMWQNTLEDSLSREPVAFAAFSLPELRTLHLPLFMLEDSATAAFVGALAAPRLEYLTVDNWRNGNHDLFTVLPEATRLGIKQLAVGTSERCEVFDISRTFANVQRLKIAGLAWDPAQTATLVSLPPALLHLELFDADVDFLDGLLWHLDGGPPLACPQLKSINLTVTHDSWALDGAFEELSDVLYDLSLASEERKFSLSYSLSAHVQELVDWQIAQWAQRQ